jgi:hypothetical protein
MITILLLFFFYIFIYYGIFIFIQIVILTIIFFASNFIIGINPFVKEMYIIRIVSIFIIILILSYNSHSSTISIVLILPFSIDKISYFHESQDFIGKKVYIDLEENIERFLLFKEKEVSDFLVTLDNNENYICILEFIPDISVYDDLAPQLILSKPFLINHFSSSTVITKFMNERLDYMVDYYYLDDSIIHETKLGSGPIILLKYAVINL